MFNSRFKKLLILCMSLIVLFSGFYYKSVNAITVEGNNTAKTAFEIATFPYTADFKIDSPNDVDWFKIIVNKTGNLKINIEGDGIRKDFYLYPESEINSTNPKNIYSRTWFNECNTSYKVNTGVYYLKVEGYNSNEWSENKQTIKLNLLEEDQNENNDTPSKATTINLGKGYDFLLNSVNDVDWFKVKVDRGGALNVQIDGDGMRKAFYLYPESEINSANPKHIYSRTWFNGCDASYKVNSGTYYLKVQGDNSDEWSESKQTIKLNLLEEDQHENNDTPSKATTINLGKSYDFLLNSVNDVDWFKVKIDRGGALNVQIDGDGMRKAFYLYPESEINSTNPKHIYSRTWFDGCNASYKVNSGTYYLKVQGDNSDEWSESKQTIKLNLLEEDQHENNDTPSKATTINLGKSYDFLLNSVNDVDWFKVKIDRGGALNVQIDGDGMRKAFYLYPESEINSTNPKHIYSRTWFDGCNASYKVNSGTYYLKVQGDNSDEWSESTQTIKLNLLNEYDFSNNTTWQNSGIVTLGQEAQIAVNAENDVDWFKFNVDSDSQIKINLQGTGSSNKSLKYYIYNESTISQSNPAAVASGTVSTNNGTIGAKLSKGNYYIKLQPNGSNDYMEEPIKLVIYKDGNDVTRPTITGKTPTGNNVDVYSNIEVTFSRPMNTSTLTKDNIKVKCYNEEIDFDIEWVEGTNKLVLKPKNRLNFSSEYTVEISNNVKADNGYTLLKSYSWGFNTREKRTTDDLVGTISGSVKLTDNLQGLATAATIEVYSGTKKVKTAYPDRYGKFVINDIPEGTYRVWAKLPGFLDVSKEVKVTAYNDTSIQLSPIYGDLNDDDIIDIFDISGLSTQYDKRSQ